MDDRTALLNLLYRYGAHMDAGDFASAARMLSKARVRLSANSEIEGVEMEALWRERIILYPCGTPRTQHLITNPVLDIDPAGHEARCSSCYTVLQQTDALPLQIIAAGRYEDRFRRDADGWHFAFRDYSHFNFQGELSHHLR